MEDTEPKSVVAETKEELLGDDDAGNQGEGEGGDGDDGEAVEETGDG